MSGWRAHTGMATALDIENVDTDQLIPARFMSTPRAKGYGRFLLYDLRFESDGVPRQEFPLNRHPHVSILVARRNFGSGSSREAAVYALSDFGIRAVIAPSFGDIFAANCINNGLLPAEVGEDAGAGLIHTLGDGQAQLTLNIDTRTITVGDRSIAFTLSEAAARKLINGWDDVDLTEHHRPAIAAYRARRATLQPWAFPAGDTAE
ncbi:MAG: 3-isopropylmalate dehydratase small subunit [Pseudomonadota bacterium]